jgi:hypothetical protein
MNEFPLNSSALLSFTYDPEHQLLWIRFRTGDVYVYDTVPATIIHALVQASSQGKYFNSVIRGHFSCRRLS